MPARLLVKNATVVSMDPSIGDLDGADILIEGDRIEAVGHGLQAADAEVMDASGHVVIPGLVNAHIHTWEFPLRGIGADWVSKRDYHGNLHQNLATRFTAQDVRHANLMGALNQFHCGTTTIMDWCHIVKDAEMADAALDALDEAGIRAVFAHGTVKPPIVEGRTPYYKIPFPREAIHRLRTGRLASDDGMITLAMAILGPTGGSTTSPCTTSGSHGNTGCSVPRIPMAGPGCARSRTACRGSRAKDCSARTTTSPMATASPTKSSRS